MTGIESLPHGWRVVRLGDVAEVVMGQSPPGSTVFELDSDNQIDTGLPFIQGNAEFGDYFPHPVKWCVKPRKTAEPGDTLISVRAPVGDTNRAIETIAIGRGLVAVRFTAVDPDFGWHAINLAKVELERVRQGTTFDAIGKKDIANLTISIPPIDQQRKIAEVLDSIDDAIERTEAVIGATEQVRDALLYELLSRGMPSWHSEWRDVPGVGTLPASWDVVRLGDVADITKGTSITKSQTILGDIPVIGGGFVPSYYHNQANRMGETVTVSASGAHAGFVSYHHGPIFASDCSTIKPKNDHISTKFLFRLLKSKQAYIYDRQSGTGQPHIYPKDLQGIRVPLPSRQEQRAIYGVLNSVDDSLECLRSERDSMQVLKRSVADGLLTGRVRAPVVRD